MLKWSIKNRPLTFIMSAPLDIRVVAAFVGDGGEAVVARQDFSVVGEGHKLFANALYQCVMVAAGQVGASDAKAEQCVT